eukprot:UN20293
MMKSLQNKRILGNNKVDSSGKVEDILETLGAKRTQTKSEESIITKTKESSFGGQSSDISPYNSPQAGVQPGCKTKFAKPICENCY